MITGNTLRLMRLMKGIKQETVAAQLGISQPAYCKIEKCECIEGKKLQKVLEALYCTEQELDFFKEYISRRTAEIPANIR